jgi:hypothetical protein
MTYLLPIDAAKFYLSSNLSFSAAGALGQNLLARFLAYPSTFSLKLNLMKPESFK